MRERDQHRIAEWIGDAFAILCVRVDGLSAAEAKVRRGFEEILRQLGTSPLRIASRVALPPYGERPTSTADLRHILKALDACLAVFTRYAAGLTDSQRKIQSLVQATRAFAEEALRGRAATLRTNKAEESPAEPPQALHTGVS